MSNTDPLRLNGAKFHRDKTGLISIVEPWEVYSLDQCANWEPSVLPLGLPITDRSAEEFETGTWQLTLTYEGEAGESSVSFDSSAAIEVELDSSLAQESIKSHPNWEALKKKYGWLTDKEEFPDTMPGAAGDKTALSGAKKKPTRNPMHGTESWLSVGAVFRITYSSKSAPRDALEGVGTVVDRPPGFGLLGIAHPKGRNWLKDAPKVRVVGNASRISTEYIMSGPHGWLRDIYGAQQLRLS